MPPALPCTTQGRMSLFGSASNIVLYACNESIGTPGSQHTALPLLHAEVPEPRIYELVPDFIEVFIKLCSRSVDAAMGLVFPLSPEQQLARMQAARDRIPREFDKVIMRELEGKIKNDDMLSSELEDASFDYYRRLMRTGMVGASDEGHEEFMARQAGLGGPTPSELVWGRFAEEHPDMAQPTVESVASSLGIPEGEAGAVPRARLEQALTMHQLRDFATEQLLQAQAKEVASLQGRVRTNRRQATRATVNAGLGVGLGLLIFKGIGMGAQHLMKAWRRAKRQAAKDSARTGGPASARAARGTPVASVAATPTKQPPSSGQGARGAKAAPAGQQQQQGAPQQAQQQQQQASPAASRRARPSTRTR